MARPPSWLPRLLEIRRAVAGSVRSHYTRRDLEGLFQLQTSAASALMDLVPTLMQIAQWLDADPDGFAQEYEPITERAITASPGREAENLLADLERLEAEKTAGPIR